MDVVLLWGKLVRETAFLDLFCDIESEFRRLDFHLQFYAFLYHVNYQRNQAPLRTLSNTVEVNRPLLVLLFLNFCRFVSFQAELQYMPRNEIFACLQLSDKCDSQSLGSTLPFRPCPWRRNVCRTCNEFQFGQHVAFEHPLNVL